MRLITFLLALVLSSCQGKLNRPWHDDSFENRKKLTGQLVFKNDLVDLGTLPPDTIVIARFEFSNPGTDTLIIESIQPSCSCAGFELSKKATLPLDSGSLILKIDTKNKKGDYEVTATVKANTESRMYLLTALLYVN